MAEFEDFPEDFGEKIEDAPVGLDMEELMANISRMTSNFVGNQRQKPIEIQVLMCLAFLLIPLSLLLFCFCKILRSQNKRPGKDKKKQKEQKKDTKKRA
ncbi:hypothetical protein JTE90_011992 [Oedothorax gibbosus]|uniref:Uncharacterized protein n=1 Tax=Oedothorax gibbosus TaxID=931172 RepID=A0AAV6UQV5_9ARAC|nr:hypothetical protein JTE90_011992 [Oedothorax gibbosus]